MKTGLNSSEQPYTANLVSIIMLTMNGLQYTKNCVESVIQHTNERFEFIFIDNGSTDGTVDYLKTIPGATCIVNQANRGFAGGCNQGLLAAKGEYFVLLNNDTVVTKGWLTRMLWWIKQDASIGIVGVRTNAVRNTKQIVQNVPYTNLEEMHSFAEQWGVKHLRTGHEVGLISGLCILFHKELVQKIGGFDEQFYPAYGEDSDYCIRTMIAGKKLWIADDVFIHHYGRKTSEVNGNDPNLIQAPNRDRFQNKWQIDSNFNNFHSLAQREKPFNPIKHFVPLIQ